MDDVVHKIKRNRRQRCPPVGSIRRLRTLAGGDRRPGGDLVEAIGRRWDAVGGGLRCWFKRTDKLESKNRVDYAFLRAIREQSADVFDRSRRSHEHCDQSQVGNEVERTRSAADLTSFDRRKPDGSGSCRSKALREHGVELKLERLTFGDHIWLMKFETTNRILENVSLLMIFFLNTFFSIYLNTNFFVLLRKTIALNRQPFDARAPKFNLIRQLISAAHGLDAVYGVEWYGVVWSGLECTVRSTHRMDVQCTLYTVTQ